jgi:hypothetical protein
VHKFGHVPELLVTFGLSYVILELVKLIWGLSSVPFLAAAPAAGPGLHAGAVPGRPGSGRLGRRRRPLLSARPAAVAAPRFPA